jgi:hypothetical protein
MRLRVVATLLTSVLLSGTGWAQDGLRSASLPERNLDRTRDSRDLFLATPDTYAPGSDRVDRARRRRGPRRGPIVVGPWYPSFPGPVPYAFEYGGPAEAGHYVRDHDHAPAEAGHSVRAGIEDRALARAASPPAAPARPPLPPNPPGEPKTFYVIPWCYAGDTPPRADRLPERCEIADLRVMPPR